MSDVADIPEVIGSVDVVQPASETAEPEIPKQRIKRPTRPDDAAHKQKVEALQDIITKNKARVEEIKKVLDDRRNGRNAGSSEQQTLKNKLTEVRGQFQTVKNKKQHLRDQLDTATKTREAVRASLRELKANMKFTTVEQIDEAIEKLENRMQHSSLSLTEEKKVLDDIRKLKASRTAVGLYSEKLETLAQDDTARAELLSGIKILDEELTKLRQQEDALREELAVLRQKEQEAGSDVPGLLAERDTCREVCKQAYEKIKDLKAAHDTVWKEFKAQEKIWRAQQDEDRAQRREQAALERAARDAARAARLAEMAAEPFDKEITTCEQLTSYLCRFVVSNDAPASEPEPATGTASAMEGMKLLKRADEDDFLLLSAGKKGKGKAKKSSSNAAAGPQAPSSAPSSTKLTHSLDILEAFSMLKLSVPMSVAAIPSVLEEVAAKKEIYLRQRAEVKAKGEEESAAAEDGGKADPSAAVEAPTANGGAPEEKKIDSSAKKKGGKNASGAAPPRLDDAESWPAMGESANGTIKTSVDDNEEEENEADEANGNVPTSHAIEAEVDAAPAPEEDVKEEKPTAVRPVSVSMKADEDSGVSVVLAC